MKKILFLLFLPTLFSAQPLTTVFEDSKGNSTATYHQVIEFWKKMDQRSTVVKMHAFGESDAGFPLHVVTVSASSKHDLLQLRKENKRIILINNGIHPGEPDGIDASMLLVRDIVTGRVKLPDNVVLAIIPVYNIGGCLNRSANFRVDQDGPEEFGFRGNSRNYDLNRDFIKSDTKEARTFTKIFHWVQPDVFVDNHVSNGADYQHTMTLIASQHNRLGGTMGEYLNTVFEPAIYSSMKAKGLDLIPYVNSFGSSPKNGWPQFWDGPRYSTGYASLWNVFAFMPESHMLKPYPKRVEATYELMKSFIEFTSLHSSQIAKLRSEAINKSLTLPNIIQNWELDKTSHSERTYKGYESGEKNSDVSGLPRLYYDRSKPYQTTVPFYNNYTAKEAITRPKAYLIPQGWWTVIERLKDNHIRMEILKGDSIITVETYRIESFKTSPRPFEGHYLNTNVQVSTQKRTLKFRKGDYLVPMNQAGNRFIMEVLEPQMEDSYFAWNFFDTILQQKEGYSAYAFEDIAAEYLKTNPELKSKLEARKTADPSFAKDGRAQLNFIFQNSPWYEPSHMSYPVVRLH